MTTKQFFSILAMGLVGGSLWAAGKPVNRPPIIKHDPVPAAAPGQPVLVRAVVKDNEQHIKSVTLYYSTSRDAAPFKMLMQDSGVGTYFGTIPGNMIASGGQVSYYIEAVDELDATSETPWYTIRTQSPQQAKAAAAGTGAEKPSSWRTPALVGAGVVALAGAGVAIASASGGSSHGADSSTTTTNAGTYVGSVTTCLEMAGSPASCSSHAITFNVVSDGIVSSDSLSPGEHLEARLTGNDFTMTAHVVDTNLTSQISYIGTILSGRITGAVDGTAVAASGTNGVYSGTFNALRQ